MGQGGGGSPTCCGGLREEGLAGYLGREVPDLRVGTLRAVALNVGSWACSIHITWELVGNAGAGTPPQTFGIKRLGAPNKLCFKEPSLQF